MLILCALLLAIAGGMLFQFVILRSRGHVLLGPDFIDYLLQSEQALGGRFPDLVFKPPGCMLWILLYRAAFGAQLAHYPAFCIAAIGLLPLLSALVGHSLAGWPGAILAAALTLVRPASLHVSLLAETPATLFVAAALVAALYSGRLTRAPARLGLACVAALLAFVSFQSRPDYLLYLPAIAAIPMLDDPARATLTAALGSPRLLVLGGTWAALMGALVLCTAPQYGAYGPVRYDAYLRYYTVFQDLGLQPPPGQPSVRLIRASLVQAGVRPEHLDGRDDLGFTRAWFVVRAALKESGFTWAEADHTMNAAAMSAMRSNAGRYLARVASTFGNFLLFRKAFGSDAGAPRAPPIEVPADVYARLHALHFNSRSAEYRKAEELYEELRTHSAPGSLAVPRLRGLQARFGFLVIYPGIGLALLLLPRRHRWMVVAGVSSVVLIFLAYATGGFFDDRYLSGHCFVLSSLAAVGYARVLQRIMNLFRGAQGAIESRPTEEAG